MTYIEETDEIKNSVKNFCQKEQRYRQLERKRMEKQKKQKKPFNLRIPIGKAMTHSKPYGTRMLEVQNCSYNTDMSEYEIRIQELTKLDVPNQYGDTELRGGEMILSKQFRTKVKLDNTPVSELEIYSMSNTDSALRKIGLDFYKLKFVNEKDLKYKDE